MNSKGISMGTVSVLLAVLLAAWEIYFFWFSGHHALGPLDGAIGLFAADRLGMNMAWVAFIYLTVQLLSIPFSVGRGGKFMGAMDSMASLLPLLVTVVVMFGKPYLLDSPQRWEVAILLLLITLVDLFGGFVFNIALSRRTIDQLPAG